MKSTIKKIIREEIEDFKWIDDMDVDFDMSPAEFKMRYGSFPKIMGLNYITNNFNDLSLVGDKIFLDVGSWVEFSELFRDDIGGDGYINRDLAKAIFSEDHYWSDYDNVISDWEEDVWGIVENNDELLTHIKKYIEKYFVVPNDYNPNQLDLFTGEKIKQKDVFEIDGEVLDTELFNKIISDDSYLGSLIKDNPTFEDLKYELSNAYESCYNSVAQDNVWRAAHGSITDLFGEGEWVEFKTGRGYTDHYLRFEVTDLVLESIDEWIDDCIHNCRRWFKYDEDDEEEFGSEEDAFVDYCEECVETPFNDHSNFISFYSEYLYETSSQLNPRYYEWPDTDDIVKCFPDDVYSRI